MHNPSPNDDRAMKTLAKQMADLKMPVSTLALRTLFGWLAVERPFDLRKRPDLTLAVLTLGEDMLNELSKLLGGQGKTLCQLRKDFEEIKEIFGAHPTTDSEQCEAADRN